MFKFQPSGRGSEALPPPESRELDVSAAEWELKAPQQDVGCAWNGVRGVPLYNSRGLRIIICIRVFVNTLLTGSSVTAGSVWSCPFGGVNSNQQHRGSQGPENPSQFRVQATTALTDEGSVLY